MISSLYAPPSDGAAAVVHAATVPWGQERAAAAAINRRWARNGGNSSARPGDDLRVRPQLAPLTPSPHSETCVYSVDKTGLCLPWLLQHYARGLFASPFVTQLRGTPQPPAHPGQLLHGVGDTLRGALWGLSTLVHSCLDWPVRNLSGEDTRGQAAPHPVCECAVPEIAHPRPAHHPFLRSQAATCCPRRAACLRRPSATTRRWRRRCGTCRRTAPGCRASPACSGDAELTRVLTLCDSCTCMYLHCRAIYTQHSKSKSK